MDCLRCSACSNNYTDSARQLRLPRVLILCGHTFCQKCIEEHLQNQKITCFSCQKTSMALNCTNFPINQTLIGLLKSTKSPPQHLCKTHNKKLQAYCDKQKQLICVQCTLTTHRFHKASLISAKAQADRSILKQSLEKIVDSYHDSKRTIQKLSHDQSFIESSFLDLSMEIGIFYKHVTETISSLQEKELERLKRQKEQILNKIQIHKNQTLQRQGFHEQLQQLYSELCQVNDIQFLRRENQQSFIINNCRSKNNKYSIPNFQFKRVSCLQQIMNNLQQMINFQKKKIIHSNSVCVPNKDGNGLHGSPSVKKTSKEPAVLQVNLSQEYNKRKINQPINKKAKPTKKTINISNDKQKEKEKIIEAISSGRTIQVATKEGKNSDLKFIRESSIKKHKQSQSFFYDELQMSQNFATFSVNSFMRTSRDSQMSASHLHESSIKQSFNSFSLFEIEEKIYHFGGRAQSVIEKYYKQSNKCEKINMSINRKALQIVYHRPFSNQKCLLLGGTSNSTNQMDAYIYQFNFKTQKLTKTPFALSNPRSNFGCISKDDSIFIMGGKIQRPLNTFEKLDIKQNKMQITKMPNMVQARQDLGFCLGFDGFIYVAGGVNNSNNILNSCQRYNEVKKAWEAVPHMKHQRRGFTLIAAPHGIFAIGGHSNLQILSAVQIFDFNRGEWIDLAPMNEARCYHSAVLSRDYQTITIFGGFADKRQLDSIQIYEIDNNKWISSGKMKQKRCLHASIISPF